MQLLFGFAVSVQEQRSCNKVNAGGCGPKGMQSRSEAVHKSIALGSELFRVSSLARIHASC